MSIDFFNIHRKYLGSDPYIPTVLLQTAVRLVGNRPLDDSAFEGGVQVVCPKGNDAEEPVLVLESRQKPVFVVILRHGLVANPAKATATTFHEGHALEHIGQDGVSADALDVGVQHVLGQPAAPRHAAGRADGHAVVVDVDMDFAAEHQVVSMYQRVDESLGDAALGVAGSLLPC